jgi:hypothetical protein
VIVAVSNSGCPATGVDGVATSVVDVVTFATARPAEAAARLEQDVLVELHAALTV